MKRYREIPFFWYKGLPFIFYFCRVRTLADLKPGESAVVSDFTDQELALRLIEMGCLPGEKVVLEKTAPLGCPIQISIGHYQLCVRLKEARTIQVE